MPKKSPICCLLILIGLLLSACAPNDQLQPGATASPGTAHNEATSQQTTNSPTDTSTPPSSPTPTVPPIPLSEYQLSAVLDYDLHHLSVDEQITYINPTNEALPQLLLLVEPNLYPNGFQLKQIAWEGGETISDYTLSGNELRIPLKDPLPSNASLSLALSYELNLPNQNNPYGYSEKQTNLGDWYPYVPPYRAGEGWLVRQKAYLGEHLAFDPANFEVEIRLTSPYAASGLPLTIAASALSQNEGEVYRYQHLAARNFAWTVSDLYQVHQATVDDITVISYNFPYHVPADLPALQESAKALGIFSDLFSPYPHPSLSVVEADFLDGMEYDGLIFLSHAFYDYYTGDQKSNLTIIAAHEVAHQWWYGLVGNDQALEPWLDEALSTYSEALFYEKAYPDLVDWWWQNRIDFHKPEGAVDSTIYEPAGFDPYRKAVYMRGAMFLRDLRAQMGDEAFFSFLRDYLAKYTHRLATGDDFFALLAQHTDADLTPLIQTYFQKP